jgi:hypothetical protein
VFSEYYGFRAQPREYDRSVFERDFCKRSVDCPCMMCSRVPVVVLSPGKTICKEYDIGLRNVNEFVDGGVLQHVQERSFLIYGQQFGEHIQVAVLAALNVEDCRNGIVKKHENIIKEPELPGSPVRRRTKVPIDRYNLGFKFYNCFPRTVQAY